MTGNNAGSEIGRRNLLKTLGAVSLAGFGGLASGSPTRRDPAVVRLRGTYDDPLSYEQTSDVLTDFVRRVPGADDSLLADEAVPVFEDGARQVEYLARIGPGGHLSQFHGAAFEDGESKTHARADDTEGEFTSTGVSTTSTSTTFGDDWSYVLDDQAYVADHWGELNNNFEWYRIRDSTEERNAFRTRAASSDDTILGYDRDIHVNHDWGVSELGSEAIHEADPDTTNSGGLQSVSIGFPPSAELTWGFDADGSITQNLTNSGPKIEWSHDIPNDGTSWFHPGSHVVSNPANCSNKQRVANLKAKATWGLVYKLTHTWKISTVTC